MSKLTPFAGWTALITGFLALLIYITLPELLLWVMIFGGLSVANGLFFVIVDRKNVRRALGSRQAIYGINATVLMVVMLGILVFVNLLSVRHKVRWDFTETGYFTLAPQTQKILKGLDREIKMTAFFTGTDDQRDAFMNLMQGFLDETDKIDLHLVDPDKNPAIVKQYGVTTYGAVALESGGKSTQIKKATEENLTNAILQVTTDRSKKVYFLEGHGERSIEDKEKLGYSKALEALQQDGFQVEILLLLQAGKVPDDADLLVINGPVKVMPRVEQEAIEAYLNRGGSVLLLMDPQVEVGMGSFLKRWGIELRDDLIVDPMSRLFGGDYAAPVVNQYAEHGITKDFALPTIFPVLRSVNPVKADNITTTELLFSGANSWAETDYGTGKVQFDQYVDTKGPVPVAVAVEKIIAPAEQKAPDADPAASPAAGEKRAHLVVIGDSDFATNQYFGFSGNGDFFSNSASWLLEEENLISIRPRERKNTPLTLTNLEGTATFVIGTILLPGAVLLGGLRLWWKRRKL